MSFFGNHLVKPQMVVFDLDYTLWPFWVDTHVDPPFIKDRNGVVKDRGGATVEHYPHVPEILLKLKEEGHLVGVASRTSEIEGANQLLRLFEWERHVDFKEIYPGCKITHFERISHQSKVPLSEMLFLDDETRNIKDLRGVGVTSFLVKSGVDKRCIQEAFQLFAQEKTRPTRN